MYVGSEAYLPQAGSLGKQAGSRYRQADRRTGRRAGERADGRAGGRADARADERTRERADGRARTETNRSRYVTRSRMSQPGDGRDDEWSDATASAKVEGQRRPRVS